MRYFILSCVVVAAISCTSTDKKSTVEEANRDSVSRLALQDTAKYTEVQWLDSTIQDLGNIKEGQLVEISWRLKNVGQNPLVIAKFEPTCGCTTSDVPAEPIMPGKEYTLTAKFNSRGQSPGGHDKNLTLQANMKPNAVQVLGFHANIVN